MGDGDDENQEHPEHERAPDQTHSALHVIDVCFVARAELGTKLHAAALVYRVPETYADRTAAAGENEPVRPACPRERLCAPAVNRIFEIADDREARGGQARGEPV